MAEKSKKPKIRFAGFTEDWEQRKAICLGRFSKGCGYSKADLVPSGTPIILYGRLYTNYQFAISEVDTYALKKKNSILSKGNEVIVPASGETAEDIARASSIRKAGVILGGDLNIIEPIPSVNSEFLALAISNGYPQKILAQKAQGKSVVHIHNSDIQDVPIAYPSREEQNRIAEFFLSLDHLITLHQRSCNLTTRHADCASDLGTIAWEQRRFSDQAETRRGLTYKPSDVANSGIRVLRSSNIDEDIFICNKDDVFVNINAINISYVKNGDILITSANGSSRLVGKHAIIQDITINSTVHGGFMLIASANNPYFLNASMSSLWYSRFISLFASGGNGAIGNLNKKNLDEQFLWIPCEKEQTRIGTFFRHLDHLITPSSA